MRTDTRRKARKEARREKQRKENVHRAAKMHTYRLAAKSLLPPKTNRQKRTSGQLFYLGCSGWFYWHWRGIFYPEGDSTNNWFNHYARNFKTVELNAPFYSWPTVNTVKSWVRQLGRKKFIYTIKVCELITHTRRFRGTKELIRDFGCIADILGPHMGCFLFQLPPSFKFTRPRLELILSQLDPTRRNVVEFRHASWWNDSVFDAFKEAGAIFCSCSAPKLPEKLIVTSEDVYVRFHGTSGWYRHDYSDVELGVWARSIKGSKAKRAWIYFNNDRNGYAIKNAKCLMKLLTA